MRFKKAFPRSGVPNLATLRPFSSFQTGGDGGGDDDGEDEDDDGEDDDDDEVDEDEDDDDEDDDDGDNDADDDLMTGKQCSVRPTESQAHWIRGPYG